MKLKPTIMVLLWVFLMYAHQAIAGPPGANSTHSFYAPPPAAGFTYSASSGCVPVTVQFYSQLNGPSYSWTFGDGGTSSDCNPVHTYTVPGVYTVTLVATGGMYTTTITVGANPVVTFTGDSVSCQNDSKTYTASSTIAPASYSWTAQGGSVTSSTATSANITWSSYGINYVNYTITTPAGCTKIFRYKVKVIPPPVFDLPCCDKRETGQPHNPDPTEAGEKDTVKGGAEPCSVCALGYNCYSATINPEFGTISDYIWNWTITNGTVVSLSNDSSRVCVIWGAGGTGKIKLEMIHKIYGCRTVKECEVLIMPGVTPAFTVSGTCVGSPVNFEASGTSPLADVETFAWEFGDGYNQTSVSPFTTHTFAFAGSYTATLTITTTSGCTYKTTKTFTIISGTKPKIECPGTVCEGSRQCYTTTAVPGATYNWTITGDDASQRVVTGNQVCVTWGSGPAGTVSVTVIGGGYTCTNTVTEAVAIVSSVIPINAPDFICSTSNFLEVSTVNYAGACYKWSVNGATQAVTTNTLVFNPAMFGNPIIVKVEVDFPVGCCHGSGVKEIKKLPQYTMFTYNSMCAKEAR